MENLYYLIPLSGVLAVVFGLMRSSWISKQNPGNEKMQEIIRLSENLKMEMQTCETV